MPRQWPGSSSLCAFYVDDVVVRKVRGFRRQCSAVVMIGPLKTSTAPHACLRTAIATQFVGLTVRPFDGASRRLLVTNQLQHGRRARDRVTHDAPGNDYVNGAQHLVTGRCCHDGVMEPRDVACVLAAPRSAENLGNAGDAHSVSHMLYGKFVLRRTCSSRSFDPERLDITACAQSQTG